MRRKPALGQWAIGAPSKLNCPMRVPPTALTLTAIPLAERLYAAGAHATVVVDVHAVLPHSSAAAREDVGVTTKPPKARPPIVMVPLPVTPTFGGLLVLTHGAGTRTKHNANERFEGGSA